MKTRLRIEEMIPFLPSSIKDAVHHIAKEVGLKTDVLELHRHAHSEKAAVNGLDPKSRKALKYVSARTQDRDDEIVIPEAIKLDEFLKYKSVLCNHNYSTLPIGSDDWILADDFGIKALTSYAETGPGTLAEICWILVRDGHMKSSSIGFVPTSYTKPGARDWDHIANQLQNKWSEFDKQAVEKSISRIITGGVLLEHSDVSVPANTDAEMIGVVKAMNLTDKVIKQLGWEVKEEKVPCVCDECGYVADAVPGEKCPECKTGTMKAKEKEEEKAITIINTKQDELNGPRTEAQRAMAHFKISEEDWNALPDDKKKEYIDKLPPRGTAGEKKTFLELVAEGIPDEMFPTMKPYPNEHASRQTDPDKYKRFARQKDKGGDGVDFIFGILPDGKTELQSIRFNKDKFTPEQAKKWLKEHDMAETLEEAKGEEKSVVNKQDNDLVESLKRKLVSIQRTAEGATLDKADELMKKLDADPDEDELDELKGQINELLASLKAIGDGRGRMGGPYSAGPGGVCKCPECGHEQEHDAGTPCTDIKCVKCGAAIVRKEVQKQEIKIIHPPQVVKVIYTPPDPVLVAKSVGEAVERAISRKTGRII